MANLDEMTFGERVNLYKTFIHAGVFKDDYRTALIEENLADYPKMEAEFINAQLPVLMAVKEKKTRERFKDILGDVPIQKRMVIPEEEQPMMEEPEPEPLAPGPVCVFWSQKNADRLGDEASVENNFNRTTGQFNGCCNPELVEQNETGGMPVCHYSLTDMSQGYVDCQYFQPEINHVVRSKGDVKMVVSRTHYPEEDGRIERKFKVLSGENEDTFDSLEAANICYRKKIRDQEGALDAAVG